MANHIEELERILGGKLERSDARVIPGTDGATTREAIYFSDDGKSKFRKQFKNITCFAEPPNATSGGAVKVDAASHRHVARSFMQSYITVILKAGEKI